MRITATCPTIAIVLGTRPEIIKLAPLIRVAQTRSIPFRLIHTNQHYSQNMDAVFFEELRLPQPNVSLGIGSAPQGEQTGKMITLLEREFMENSPRAVLVQGDTNTVLAGALAAAKLGICVGHIEAGLRSYDRSMPEEVNRVVVDHIADLLFAPTQESDEILAAEGIPAERRLITGNTVVDAVEEHRTLAEHHVAMLRQLSLKSGQYLLLTLHRPANVDDRQVLEQILHGVHAVASHCQLPVIFPAHPRTVARMQFYGIILPETIRCIEPVGYLDFLSLETQARLILTDSGGVQEEACILQVPCVTLRENTERPETVAVGANRLAGTDPSGIIAAASVMLARTSRWQNPFGDGRASMHIIDYVLEKVH